MGLVHIDIPGGSDEGRQKESGHHMHAQEFLQVPCHQKITKNDTARENNPDGPFGHDGKAAANVQEPIPAVQKTQEGRRHEEKERRIRDGCLAHVLEHDRRAHHHGGPPPGARAQEPAEGSVGQENTENRHQGGRHAGRKFRKATEQFQAAHEKPVENRRFIIPKFMINPRRQVVRETDHLFRRLGVDRFIRIQQGHPTDATKNIEGDNGQ